jgi:hypothetical protein
MFLSVTTAARPSFNFAGFPLFLRPKIHGMAGSVVSRCRGVVASRCRERDYAKRSKAIMAMGREVGRGSGDGVANRGACSRNFRVNGKR